jgi:hypothetical protein
VNIEYTAADTPQQNTLVELKFTYLSVKARAAIHTAGVPRGKRWEFFLEVIMTMTKLDWLKFVTINGVRKKRVKHYNLPLPRFAQYLSTWGEAGTIKQGKTGKKGTVESHACSWVTPPITRVTDTGCGIQKLRLFLRHVTWYFLIGCFQGIRDYQESAQGTRKI